MKTLLKSLLAVLVVGAVLFAAAPREAQARRYYSWYAPVAPGPVYYGAYYPRRVVYRSYYAPAPYYPYYSVPVYPYSAPAYYYGY